MNVIIAGASGMVGSLVLEHCLNAADISRVTSLARRPSGRKHQKLNEVIINDFEDYSGYEYLFKDIQVAFFCIGAYTGQVQDRIFKKITVDYAVAFAGALKKESPSARLCFLSGQGAYRSENSRTAFARYKGMAENAI